MGIAKPPWSRCGPAHHHSPGSHLSCKTVRQFCWSCVKSLPKDKVPSLAGTSLQPFRFPSVRFLEKVQLLGVHCFNSLIAKNHECLFRTSSFLLRCFHAQPANPTQQKQPLQQGSPTPVEASESRPGSQIRKAPCWLGQRYCQEECGSGPRSCVPKTWPQSVCLLYKSEAADE